MAQQQPSRWFYTPLRVRYQETDQMGVVYHANYLNWFEIGRTELIRELGMDYQAIEQRGLLLPVTQVNSVFHAPARYDEHILICTRIVDYSSLKLQFESEVRRLAADQTAAWQDRIAGAEPQGQLLVSGTTHHVWVNRQFRPVRMGNELPELYAILTQATERAEHDDH